jgi:outer membrane immunogenic protein
MTRFPPFTLIALCAAFISRETQAQSTPTNWTGVYGGANFGDSSDSFDFSDTSESFGTNGFNGNLPDRSFQGNRSFLAGGQIGYNRQFDKFVIGVEGDTDRISHQTSFHQDLFFLNNPFPFGSIVHANHSAELDLISSLRAKAGMGWHRFLVYATGGLGLGDLTLRTNDLSFVLGGHPGQVGSGSDSGFAVGWTAGGGAEWSITPSISIAAEYRHLDVGGSYTPSDQQLFHAHGHLDFNDDEVSLRINVHLNALFAR